jgi:hypothetical protein
VYCDAVGDHLNIDEFPSSKPDFDTMFSTTTSGGKLSCRFEIGSTSKSFHLIKIRAWDILQKYHIWFKKSPGPIKRVPLAIMGFWVNAHPGFASPRSDLEHIKTDLLANYPSHTAVLTKFGLSTTFTPPDMYLARGRVSGQCHATPPNGSIGPTNAIDTDVIITYASVDDFDRSVILVTQVSSQKSPSSRKDPMFIPFALKKTDPSKFGYCLAQQNQFLKDPRNIAIVGVVPELMDHLNPAGDSLWDEIKALPGVFRCDPCARTPDLGKWNISSALERNEAIKTWLHINLSRAFAVAHASLPKIITFPQPDVLSKDRRASLNYSVQSGLTDASPLDNYMRSLESIFSLINPPPMVARNPWKTLLTIPLISRNFPNFPPTLTRLLPIPTLLWPKRTPQPPIITKPLLSVQSLRILSRPL